MKQFTVTGMTCAACSARVEKAVSKVSGVNTCSVNLLTNSMTVEGSADDDKIIKAVEAAGYGAYSKDKINSETIEKDELKDTETPTLKRRLLMSLGFLAVLMYVSMGSMMFGFPLPKFFDGNYLAIGLLQLLFTSAVIIINKKFFVNGFKSLFSGAPNMDTLVALGSGAAFVYSTYVLFAMTGEYTSGDLSAIAHLSHEFYFESSAMILALITVGKMLEARSKGKTTNAIKGLMQLSPKTAVVIRNGNEETVSIKDVKKDDIFIVRPGENIPVDGIIIEGSTAIDESALTGESIPVDKAEDDEVFGATINTSGYIKCKATKVGEDTTLSQIIKMVRDASATKSPVAKAADKVSGVFVPFVIIASFITVFAWLILGESVGFALARGISVLVISCPCALGLATPVAIMVGSGVGAKEGILFKTAVSLEETGKIQIVALDKTGTVTSGNPEVTDVVPINEKDEKALLQLACSLEAKSEHPLSKAIMKKAQEYMIEVKESKEFTVFSGNGLFAEIDGEKVYGGNLLFTQKYADITPEIKEMAERLANDGKTPLFFVKNQKLAGIIAVADVVKEDSKKAVSELKNMGIRVVMLTGDNNRTANAVAKLSGISEVISDVLPKDKERAIKELKNHGKTAMVGDGINDAPALTQADVGVAIGAGTDIAIDAADVVLMKSRLTDVAAAIRLSRATLKNIHENLFWAFIYNIIGIPLAAGVWIGVFGWKLNPMFGAAAMSLSSFCVVTNALRLNLKKIHDSKHDKKIKQKKEKQKMQKTLKIEGMMCPHCEARVKSTLEGMENVETAEVSHEKGTAVVTLSKDISSEKLKNIVEEQGYKVINIE